MKIQLAIQGGGAKLAALIATLDALQDLENSHQLEITRLAGTSAGAIASCLYATKKPMGQYRQQLRSMGLSGLRRIFPTRNRLSLILRLLAGKAVYDIRNLRTFLGELFGSDYTYFSDLSAPVSVVAADLLNSEAKVYGAKSDRLIDSLANSCALPFIFKSVQDLGSDSIVDGGICENLPSSELGNEKDYGPIVGISFTRENISQPPSSLTELSFSLIETAVNNSVTRAKNAIGEERVFPIKTTLGTLDFEKALSEGLEDNHYKRVKMEANDWFMSFLRKPLTKNCNDELTEIKEKLAKIFLTQHSHVEAFQDRMAMIVTAYSLEQSPGPDHVRMEIVLRPKSHPIYCRKTKIDSQASDGFNPRSSWQAYSASGECHDVVAVPIATQDRIQEMLLHFVPPLPVGKTEHEPYCITQSCYVSQGMSPLLKGKDHLSLANVNKNKFDRADIILFVPEEIPCINMRPIGDFNPGRSMTQEEIIRDYSHRPAGFRALGWTIENLVGEGSFGVALEIPKWLVAKG